MKKNIGRLAAVTAAAALLFCGCRKAESSDEIAEISSPETASSATETESSVQETGNSVQEAESSVPDLENGLGEPSEMVPDISVDHYDVPQKENLEFVKNLRLGWNLGNTFDAYDVDTISAEQELDYESAWNGDITSRENIAAVKAAGFQTVRIPVSWHNHMDGNHQISEKWMARVKEVVDWCREYDLYVILNNHHDVGENYYYPDSGHLEASKTFLVSVWTQIAEAFQGYDNHLILESMNEPRLVGTNVEWWPDPNDARCVDAIQCINTLNQLFVDTIRATGGENATRYLLVPGYAAAPEGALNDQFTVPNDPANHVIVSIHAYRPYDFALNTQGTGDFSLDDSGDLNEINQFMDQLYQKFILKEIPVLIGEFGALNKDNLQERVDFAAYYTASARARGMTCCWWDNQAFFGDGENFGLLSRGDSIFLYPEIVQALVKYSKD